MRHTLSAVRVATSFRDRLIGLMGMRDPLRMRLLIPRCSSIHTAFVRLPIDVVFLDWAGVVLRIDAAVPPWRVRFGPRGTTSTLELAAGDAGAFALAIGDTLIFAPPAR